LVLRLDTILLHVQTDAGPLLVECVLVLGLDGRIDENEGRLELLNVLVLDDGNGGLQSVVAVRQGGARWLVAGDALPLGVDLAPRLALLHGSRY
jgi:hypothetical protein